MAGMRKFLIPWILPVLVVTIGCAKPTEVNSNPWLVPFQERQVSTVSRSHMRAMVRLANVYKDHGMDEEYMHSMVTAVEIFAGDSGVTFQLLNEFIDRINIKRSDRAMQENALTGLGIDSHDISRENLPPEYGRAEAIQYLDTIDELETLYEECYRILSSACGQIPYNAELYYRTAHLQYLRAGEDGDRDKYRDATAFLKRAIASDSRHLESYYLIALTYERLDDTDRAMRFWRLFEVIYEIAPETLGREFITPDRERMHNEALRHLEELSVNADQ